MCLHMMWCVSSGWFVVAAFLLLWRDTMSKAAYRKEFIGDLLTLLEGWVHDYMVMSMIAGRQAWYWSSQELRAYTWSISDRQKERERNRGWPGRTFETSKSAISVTLLPTRPHLIIFPETVLPLRNQAFKDMSLLGSFSSTPAQVCACHSMHVEIRGQCLLIPSLLPLWNLGIELKSLNICGKCFLSNYPHLTDAL